MLQNFNWFQRYVICIVPDVNAIVDILSSQAYLYSFEIARRINILICNNTSCICLYLRIICASVDDSVWTRMSDLMKLKEILTVIAVASDGYSCWVRILEPIWRAPIYMSFGKRFYMYRSEREHYSHTAPMQSITSMVIHSLVAVSCHPKMNPNVLSEITSNG